MRIRNKANGAEHIVSDKSWAAMKADKTSRLFTVVNPLEYENKKIPVPQMIEEFKIHVPKRIETVKPVETPILKKINKSKNRKK